jgi:hypothetical protein
VRQAYWLPKVGPKNVVNGNTLLPVVDAAVVVAVAPPYEAGLDPML